MKTNVAAQNTGRTYEGAPARIGKGLAQLERQVATCLLFENTYYEKGSEIAKQIAESAKQVTPVELASLAVKARHAYKLRHVPLFLLAQLDKRRAEAPGLLAATIPQVVSRPDEMGELLSIILKESGEKDLKKVLSAQVKKGLAATFPKFSEYQLAKWNRDETIKLRDVLFLTHPEPKSETQASVWKKLVDGTLGPPDTWEVALSSGADKKETWERLLSEGKLGYMALLMNLRNMVEAKVDPGLVEKALLEGASGSKALPFRFVSAVKHAPAFAQALSDAMLASLTDVTKLPGMTYVIIDVSGSMQTPLSSKGTLRASEAAGAMAVLVREVSERARVFAFGTDWVEIPNLRGLPLMGGLAKAQVGWSTHLGNTLRGIIGKLPTPDRLVVVTDEQTHDTLPILPPGIQNAYIVNVQPYAPGIETGGRITRINGWSERVVDWIRYEEGELVENSEALLDN